MAHPLLLGFCAYGRTNQFQSVQAPPGSFLRCIIGGWNEHRNTETVISINHVSKVYKLFEKPMDRLKESLSLTHKNYHTDHFALEDISLEVHKGECVGIIGTNGSGKSTLLKIVTGVLNPTSGNVELKEESVPFWNWVQALTWSIPVLRTFS